MKNGIALWAALLAGISMARGGPSALDVKASVNGALIPRYEVFEITFQHAREYADPFQDVRIEVTFSGPSGEESRIGGFLYGSSKGPEIMVHSAADGGRGRQQVEYRFDRHDLWKARFTPTREGRWRYRYSFTNRLGEAAEGTGEFSCVPGRKGSHGFVRQNPKNAHRWVFDDGANYWPIGIQECVGDGEGLGTMLASMSLEGPFRLDRQGRPEPPRGPLYRPGPSSNPVNADVYFRRYAEAGFNLFRFSQRNCSCDLYRDLDHYLIQEGAMTDELLRHARKYRFRVFYGLFGFQPVFNDDPGNAAGMEKLKRFIKYSVDRWGAMVDFWEFLNEQKADVKWYEALIPYLRSIDPYKHPITTSWERPELPGIEVNAPHWYSGITGEEASDRNTAEQAARWKRHGKPVIVGEQGNSASKEQLQTPGIGGVWDAQSALRMRLRNWSALFNEISFVFWNTSYAKDGHSMNLWIGPRERQYVRAMQDFAERLDGEVKPAAVSVPDSGGVRAYGLASSSRAAVYLHHYAGHDTGAHAVSVTLDVPRPADGYWYSPENGAILGRFKVSAGRQTLTAPDFQIDLALLITADGPPDIDHDGKPNDLDPDDDNDGAPDARDAYPLESEEQFDRDRDEIGDQLDADDDGDGIGDDANHNGTPDCREMDFDGDGVPRAGAVPWDAFPFDPQEWRDLDGDGTGDNADTDDDGDGYTDAEEKRAGTDPGNALSFPFFPAARSAGTPEPSLQVWVTDGMIRVRPDDPPGARRSVEVKAARNEYEPFQVVVTAGSRELRAINVRASELKGPRGSRIPASEIALFREHYVEVKKPTPRSTLGAGWYPDALIPLTIPKDHARAGRARFAGAPFSVPAGRNQPVWVDVHVKTDALPGDYRGSLTVSAEGERSIKVPVQLTVWPFTLPEKASLRSNFGGFGRRVAAAFQLKETDADFLVVEKRFAQAMAQHRLCPPIPAYLYPNTNPDGSIDPGSSHRALKDWMERFHVTGFPLRLLGSDPAGKDRDRNVRHLQAMYAYLQENGWEKLAYIYVLDEPNDSAAYEEVRRRAKLIHEAQPGIKVLCTEQPTPSDSAWGTLTGSVDIWVPLWPLFDEKPARERQAAGEELWSYTALCQGPRGKESPFWEIDFPLLNYRIPGWMSRRFDMEGILYWTTVYWEKAGDVWTNPDTYNGFNGEGSLFYPGSDAGIDGPVASMRLKQIREGMEDYEYLRLLDKAAGPGATAEVVRRIARSWFDWDPDPAHLYAIREEIASRIISHGGAR